MSQSAFGVDHGDISKGLKPAHVTSMSRVMTGAGKSSGGDISKSIRSGMALNYGADSTKGAKIFALSGGKKGAKNPHSGLNAHEKKRVGQLKPLDARMEGGVKAFSDRSQMNRLRSVYVPKKVRNT